uniref:Uncharacterized protein n=1 Tax=Marseillevirus LCMAC103 TaxID=2506604 RepID=A0A481YU98_9VIRU|nr:MAG: hypothetical protein LCMAC103_00730 [Marseillevirus LCMAC103]
MSMSGDLVAQLDAIRRKVVAGHYTGAETQALAGRLADFVVPPDGAVAAAADDVDTLRKYLFLGWWVYYCKENDFFSTCTCEK